MANTGWQICRSVLRVAANDNSKKLDRNGLECNLVGPGGYPVSAAGLLQAAWLWDEIDPSSGAPGTSGTYEDVYDIIGTYPINTTGLQTNEVVYFQGAIVARWRGDTGSSCEISQDVVFSSSPETGQLPALADMQVRTFSITSTRGGVPTGWSITYIPSWIPSYRKFGTAFQILQTSTNSGSSSRTDDVILTQDVSGETLVIPLTQLNATTLNRLSYLILEGNILRVTSTYPVASNVTVQFSINSGTLVSVVIASGTSLKDAPPSFDPITSVSVNQITPQSDTTYTYYF